MASDKLSVRFATRGDFDKWLPLWDGYNAFYGRAGATALAREITERTWSRFFDACEPVHCLVAESGGELLGLAHYLFHRSTTMIEPAAGFVHGCIGAGQGCRPCADRRRLSRSEPRGLPARLLADPRDQSHRPRPLRQGRGTPGIHRLPKAALRAGHPVEIFPGKGARGKKVRISRRP